MSAIEFAVKFDDGVGAGLREADIVLVGVSRTSKTPLSIYLGYLGYKAANVPLVKGIEPPPELFTTDQAKVVGLTIDAQRLSEIRGERIRWMRGDRKYADLDEIYEELEYAQRDPPAARLPGDRGERALDRGDLAPDHPRRHGAARSGDERVKPKPPVPKWRWAVWYTALGVGARPLLRPLHAVLVRPPRARLGRRVPRAPPPLRYDSRATWRTRTSTTSTRTRPADASCSAAKGSGSPR